MAAQAAASPRGPRLFFARHGEAEHNPFIVLGKQTGDEETLRQGRSILDPSLTELGRRQATALRERLVAGDQHFDLLVTTPLSRAIETSEIAFAGLVGRFLVTPEATETAQERLGGPQRGASVEVLRKKYAFLDDWDLSAIQEGENWVLGDPSVLGGAGYHHPDPVEARIPHLKAFLKALPVGRVVVVGHSGVFDKLLGLQMANCELVEHALD